jgi:hypothetical protein
VQLVVGLGLAIVYALLVATNTPYAMRFEQRLAQVCNVCLCVLFAMGLAIRSDESGVFVFDCSFLSIPFIFVALLPLLFLVLPHPLSQLTVIFCCCRDPPDDFADDDKELTPAAQTAQTARSALAANATARRTAHAELTADELAEAEDALDDFLMDDAAEIWGDTVRSARPDTTRRETRRRRARAARAPAAAVATTTL